MEPPIYEVARVEDAFGALAAAIMRQARAPHTRQDLYGRFASVLEIIRAAQDAGASPHHVSGAMERSLESAVDRQFSDESEAEMRTQHHAIESVVAASLRLAAGRIAGPTVQASQGRNDLRHALDEWASARAELLELRRRQGFRV